MPRQNTVTKSSKRQRRTGNLTQSLPNQIKQFFANCHQRNLIHNTVESYRNRLTKFEKYLMSVNHSTLVSDIEKSNIEEYLLVIKEVEKTRPNTVNSEIRHLKAFFTHLYANDVINTNLMAKIKKLRVDEEPLKPFTDRQVSLLLSQPDKSTYVGYRGFVLTYSTTTLAVRL